ncbi:hypothetical protein A3H10_00985 [Candidatus Uhrbacteria bacterium RIFCSPLOWO2_12_FULL_46_10]|uniref:Large ribosomal subunit protein bL25 n=1 Tax=Candidatus Uhrbacteria bacterium RIFCSPLOWO2_01_FULL_47_25 TaxID=1802402 RepID=A0A1F7UYD7_9BACT|nr:MAG: 50S ribosomal protein L25 [Parcubacteria group bacterium GW2011_GWA2_46_9]OGL60182.1 MAG: hypothetical protein A2752_00940 [Candidatus Uhrbacteria bacterium RIFCSPHIGHO2_01_FULL_46_23]OGL69646.1 MAG: hypothetical protein A3D60_02910 [Candidatus Uhrbacteria bacterium RIFCSPHIGHO2_02_FULL_47_29]OGL75876.1 MAG: hypothetical protein A3E96_04840 [Candidatus Uhrbacteria bacterium RIFCSPHIGHO2_12_FULL_46_13]OGL82707.1 MAG: hypothetical protein A2936_03925 [Candidatus Uhrbacteria bacterium RIFC
MTYSLQVATRTLVGKKNKLLRGQGLIPGVVYGHGETNRSVEIKKVPFEKLFQSAGESSLVDLNIDEDASLKVLIHDIQRHPVTGQIIHVDFYQVKMTEKLTADVPLVFIGEAKAVKELGGVLVKTLDHVKVECLPQDLVHELKVNLSSLETFDDAIHVKDIVVPTGINVLSSIDDMVVSVQPPRTEEEAKIEGAEAPVDVSEVEVEKEKKDKEVKGSGEEVRAEGKKEKS